ATLLRILESGNEESRLLAVELLLRHASDLGGLSSDLLERILTARDRFSGDPGRIFYSLLLNATGGDRTLHAQVIGSLHETFSRGDASTVLELVRHVSELGLTEREYADSVTRLCRFAG